MKPDLISRRSFLSVVGAVGCCPDRLRRRCCQHCLFRSYFL